MDGRAVIALRVILEDQFPVGVDIVVDPADGPDGALAVAKNTNALSAHVSHQIVARSGNLFLTSGANPSAREDSILFRPEDLVRGIKRARQCARIVRADLGGGNETGHRWME